MNEERKNPSLTITHTSGGDGHAWSSRQNEYGEKSQQKSSTHLWHSAQALGHS